MLLLIEVQKMIQRHGTTMKNMAMQNQHWLERVSTNMKQRNCWHNQSDRDVIHLTILSNAQASLTVLHQLISALSRPQLLPRTC